MKCPACSKKMILKKKSIVNYRYLESGLDNVFLRGIDIYDCSCGESIVSIPAIDELHRLLAHMIVKKRSLLTGREIRFLRKNVGLSAKKLADRMGVKNETVSRWENDHQKLTKSNDFLIRLIYCNMKGIPSDEIGKLIDNEFPAIEETYKEIPPYIIPKEEWSKENCSTV